MSWPASVIVDAVFIPIYIVLLLLSLFSVLKHGHGKTAGFVFIAVFCVARLIGNILLVYSFHNGYKNTDTVEWGYILQSLGYSFFISATLAFYNRARDPDASPIRNITDVKQSMSRAKALHLINTLALLLLILGYTDSTGLFPSAGSSATTTTLDVKAKVGDLLFLALTVIIAVLCIVLSRKNLSREARFIIFACLVAFPFMACRSVYVTYQAFSKNPLQRTLWAKVSFDYVVEVFIVVIYSALGFILAKESQIPDMERKPNNGEAMIL